MHYAPWSQMWPGGSFVPQRYLPCTVWAMPENLGSRAEPWSEHKGSKGARKEKKWTAQPFPSLSPLGYRRKGNGKHLDQSEPVVLKERAR